MDEKILFTFTSTQYRHCSQDSGKA